MQFTKFQLTLNSLLLIMLLTSCSFETNREASPSKTVLVQGRDNGQNAEDRPYVYRVSIPPDWNYIEPKMKTSNFDSRLPIDEFSIGEGEERIHISVHNFPPGENGLRIAPMAQIARWKRQFTSLNHTKSSLIPQSFNGYFGFRFEGSGILKGNPTTIIGWALQLGSEHFLTLSYPRDEFDDNTLTQMRSDVTIKVTGSPKNVEKHKQAIDNFARSFELIHEIPSSLL
jgi:hypothetical protein